MVQQISRPMPWEEPSERVVCHHHWIIESPDGPVSGGVCKLCGATKEFKNYIDETPWGEDASATQPDAGDPALSSARDEETSDEI